MFKLKITFKGNFKYSQSFLTSKSYPIFEVLSFVLIHDVMQMCDIFIPNRTGFVFNPEMDIFCLLHPPQLVEMYFLSPLSGDFTLPSALK